MVEDIVAGADERVGGLSTTLWGGRGGEEGDAVVQLVLLLLYWYSCCLPVFLTINLSIRRVPRTMIRQKQK